MKQTDAMEMLEYQRLQMQAMHEELREIRQELAQAVSAHLIGANLVVVLTQKVEALHQLVDRVLPDLAAPPDNSPRYVGVSLADWPPQSPS